MIAEKFEAATSFPWLKDLDEEERGARISASSSAVSEGCIGGCRRWTIVVSTGYRVWGFEPDSLGLAGTSWQSRQRASYTSLAPMRTTGSS